MRLNPDLVAALETAPVPQPFDLLAYLKLVRGIRGRRLFVHDLPDSATGVVNGLWISSEDSDHIFVAPGARGLLRVQIILHEVSHMLLDHGKVAGSVEMALSRLLGPVLGGGANRVAGRSRYESTEERDAERLATLLLMRANEPPDDENAGDEGLRRLRQTFGYE
ncbi:hypothetical protein ACIHFD_49745 [Nonomuraea sp. NPDC051941]|uniref:hypothetical protein n=1 Tax=Nonomuraea sp. NPDC051941 TaxID=3364373 RepID=UPI0037CA5FAF